LATAGEEILEGTVTVLFTDVQGSTEMRTQRGDEAAGSILRAQEELVRSQVEAHSGREVKGLGDGFLVAFGSARKAVSCAVAIQTAIQKHNRSHPEQQVLVRIGLNSGEVSQEDGDLFGAAVDAAARVTAKAKGGEIMVSGVVKQLAGKVANANFVDRGRFRLKGFDDRWQLFEVCWESIPEEPGHRHLDEAAPLVGREREMAELMHDLDDAAQGRGRLVMLGGELGVGKTRLAQEILDEARRRGYLAVTGRAYESEGSPPYSPFIELVEDAGRQVDDATFLRALGDSGGEVARLVPGLRRRFPELPAPMQLPPEQERRFLYNSIRDFVVRASSIQPVCVLLDDLQWADEGSLLLADLVAESLGDIRVLLIGTYRDTELDLRRPLARTLDGLVRRHLARRVSVRRLPETEVARMLAAMGGADPPKALVRSIFAETEGNPFFVEEVFKHLAESGLLFDATGAWRSDLDVTELEVPESVRLVIGRRLQRLGEVSHQAISSAAVIGRRFDFRLLAALLEAGDEDALLDALDEAERAGLVSSSARGDDVEYEFAHELMRQTLLGGLSALRRQRLHLRVANAMEEVYGRWQSEQAADIARHLLEAGAPSDRARAVRYLDLAGQQALSSAAFEDALRTYERAQALAPADDLELEAAIKRGLGQAYRSLGMWNECQAAWAEAIDIYEGLGQSELVANLCGEQAIQLTWGLRYEDALLVAGRGLAAAGEEASVDRVTLLGLSGVTLSLSGNYRAGDEMTAEALQLARQLDEPGQMGYALGIRSIHHWAYMELREAVELGTEAMAMARDGAQLWREADIGAFTAMALHFLGRDAEAAAVLDGVEALAERLGHRQAATLAFRVRNMMATRDAGAIDRHLAWVLTDRENWKDFLSIGSWESDAQALEAVGQFWAGRWEEAAAAADRATQIQIFWVWNSVYTAVKGLVAAYRGDRETALMAADAIERETPAPGDRATIGFWSACVNVPETLIMIGERERAAKFRPLLERTIEAGAVSLSYTTRLVQLGAALAAWADGDWDAAQAHLAKAEDRARDIHDDIQGADIKRFRAMMLLDRNEAGDAEAADRLLRAAAAAYAEIGMPRHLALTEEMLAGAWTPDRAGLP
jgi:class 3 adenylate cyclase/tetratricopeptide (TPR) repeat protein